MSSFTRLVVTTCLAGTLWPALRHPDVTLDHAPTSEQRQVWSALCHFQTYAELPLSSGSAPENVFLRSDRFRNTAVTNHKART